MSRKPPPHVVILGCGRSGTSIFGELFGDLPDYQYHSEPPFDQLLTLDYAKPHAIKVPRESEAFAPTPGLSFPLPLLLEKVPLPRQLFWIVRHPLDTIASLTVGISRNWGHHPRPQDWRDWQKRPLLEQCAHHWNYINSLGYQQVRDQVETVYFEEMVDNPATFAKRICSTIGLSREAGEFHLQNWIGRVQNRPNRNYVEAQCSSAYTTQDHTVKIGRWKENLPEDQLPVICDMVRKTAAQFGYQLPV